MRQTIKSKIEERANDIANITLLLYNDLNIEFENLKVNYGIAVKDLRKILKGYDKKWYGVIRFYKTGRVSYYIKPVGSDINNETNNIFTVDENLPIDESLHEFLVFNGYRF